MTGWMDRLSESQFEQARLAALTALQDRHSIGRLKEYSLHAAFKYWIQPDHRLHEVERLGYVVDCAVEQPPDLRLIEIQTGSFQKLPQKLNALLASYPVTIVYPIVHCRQICWIDPDTGDMSKPRLSPKTGRLTDGLAELSWIREQLLHPRLQVLLVLVTAMEYRLQNGWGQGGKRGCQRVERLPLELRERRLLTCPADYAALVQQAGLELSAPFTAKQLGQALHLKGRKVYQALHLLTALGVLEPAGTRGRACLYQGKQL